MPLVQPSMTPESEKVAGLPRSQDESNFLPDTDPMPTYCAVMEEPAAMAAPVPGTRSQTVSFATLEVLAPSVTAGALSRPPVTFTPSVPTT